MTRGRFIVLEGIDGSGTTSQGRALQQWLLERGHQVLQTHQPSDGSIGRSIRAFLREGAAPLDPRALALLFAADRLHHVETTIAPALARGTTVLCDRYVMSSWAYQSLHCDLDWVRTLNQHAPWPDLTLFLEVPVDVAMARVRARDGTTPLEIYEHDGLQQRIAAAYERFAAEARPNIVTIDGARSPMQVTTDLARACTAIGL